MICGPSVPQRLIKAAASCTANAVARMHLLPFRCSGLGSCNPFQAMQRTAVTGCALAVLLVDLV